MPSPYSSPLDLMETIAKAHTGEIPIDYKPFMNDQEQRKIKTQYDKYTEQALSKASTFHISHSAIYFRFDGLRPKA